MFWRLASLALIAVLAVGAWYLFTRPEDLFETDGEALGSSLARELDGAGGACAARGDGGRYRCAVEVDAGGGSRTRSFRLTFDGDDCWRARRAGAGGARGTQARSTGCVGLRDFVLPSKLEGGRDDAG